MAQGFEERYLDVLQDIEAAILRIYRHRPELLDSQVEAALEALIGQYTAEQRGRTSRPVALEGARQGVYAAIAEVCERRLGRPTLASAEALGPPANDAEEIVACLKRIRKSVRRITKERGRQGYLQFIASFI